MGVGTDKGERGIQRRWGRRGLAACAAIGVVASFVVAALALQWPPLRDRLLQSSLDFLNEQIAAELSVGGFDGSLLGRFTLKDVSLRYEGEVIASVDRASVVPVWRSLTRGTIRLRELSLSRPAVRAAQDEAGIWNLGEALRDPSSVAASEGITVESGADGSRPALRIDQLLIVDGDMDFVLASEGGQRLRARDLQLDLGLSLTEMGLRTKRLSAATTLLSPQLPEMNLLLVGEASVLENVLSAELVRFEARAGASELRASGDITVGRDVQLVVDLVQLADADLRPFLPAAAPPLDYRGRVELAGDWSAALFSGRLHNEDVDLGWQGQVDLAKPDAMTTKGTVRFETKNLGALLGGEAIAGKMLGTGRWQGEHGNARLVLDDLRGGILSADAKLVYRDASWGVSGALQSKRFDPSQILSDRPELNGALNMEGPFSIHDLSSSSPVANLDLSLSSSSLGEIDISSASVDLSADREAIRVKKLSLVSSMGQLDSRGRVGLGSQAPVDFEASLDLLDLSPLLKLLGQSGKGAARGQLKVVADAEQMRAHGSATGGSFLLGEMAVAGADLGFALSGPRGGPARGEVSLRASGLNVGEQSGDAELIVELAPGEHEKAKQEVIAKLSLRDAGADLHNVQFAGVAEQSGLSGELTEFAVSAIGATWRLAEPVDLALGVDHVSLGKGVLRSSQGRLTFGGNLSRRGPQHFALSLDDLSLSPLLEISGSSVDAQANLQSVLNVGGTAAAPVIELRLDAEDLWIEGLEVGRIEVEGGLRNGQGRIHLRGGPPFAGNLHSELTLPVLLSWDAAADPPAIGPFDFTTTATSIDLQVLEPFLSDVASNLGGRLDLALAAVGTPADFAPSFRASFKDATIRPLVTNVLVEEIAGEISFAGEELALKDFSARAGEGRLTASASGQLTEGAVGASVASVRLDRWPVIRSRPYSLTTSGELAIEPAPGGSVRIEGAVKVDDGTIRPAIEFLVETPPARDPTILFEDELAVKDVALDENRPPAQERSLLDAWINEAEIDVALSADRNIWIKHNMASLELYGDVKLEKDAARAGTLHGQIGTRRGWVNVQGRRFKIVEGELIFVGGDRIDPMIDVIARHKVRGYTIEARFSGRVSSPELVLTSDPSLDQSDVLAVLLFGRTLGELNSGEQYSLGTQASELAAAYGITAAGKSVANALGLEETGLQIEELSQERLSVGTYLGQKTFVSVTQEFREERSQQFSLEYEFWPGWSVVMSTTARGSNSADIVWKLRY